MRFSLLLTLLTLTAWTAQAQIELSTNNAPGHVGIGTIPESNSQLKVRNSDAGSNGTAFGIKGEAYPASSAGNAIGVRGLAGFAQYSTGMQGEASGSNTNTGVSGYVAGVSGQTSYGVRGEAVGGGVRYAGYFVGNVHVTGNLFSANGGGGGPQPLTAAMRDASSSSADEGKAGEATSLLSDIGTFRYSSLGGDRFGLDANALREALPAFVRNEVHATFPEGPDSEPVMQEVESIDYVSLVPVLVQAVGEQQSEIETLRAEIAQLRALIDGVGIER